MARVIVQLPVDLGGQSIEVEADRSSLGKGVDLVSDDGGNVAKLTGSLEQSFTRLKPAIQQLVDGLRVHGPDAFELQFSLVVGGETGLIFAKGSTEANFSVRLNWENRSRTPPAS